MARILALEWDSRELRIATAQTRGNRAVLEDAFAVPLPQGAGEADSQAQVVGAAIRAALAARGIGRTTTLVAVGRASIELKQLSLPPAPDEELPDMVRFQAMREFNSLGDDWPLDFLPFAADPNEPRQVLAAAISPELVGQIQSACLAANIRPARIVLRPCATASLLCRARPPLAESVRLLVDILADEADLTVLTGSQVAFLRTVRLAGDVLNSPEDARPLVGEIRRTIAAAQNQFGGRKVEGIDLCGGGDSALLAQRLETETGLPVAPFDPLDQLAVEPNLAANLPPHPGRFAPLAGMLADEASKTPPAIDFLQPRRRPAPPDRKRTYLRAGLLVAIVVLLVGGGISFELLRLDEEIETLAADVQRVAKAAKEANKVEADAKKIEEWVAGDIGWLDELAELAADYPPASDAMLTKLSMQRVEKGTVGQVELGGLVRSASQVDSLEAALRDDDHRVTGRKYKQDAKQQPYAWTFESSLVVAPQDKEKYRKRAESRTSAPKTAAAEPATDSQPATASR